MPLSLLLIQGVLVLNAISILLDLREPLLSKRQRLEKRSLVLFLFSETNFFLLLTGIGLYRNPSVMRISILTTPVNSSLGTLAIVGTVLASVSFIVWLNKIIQRLRSARHAQIPAEH